jgi:ABC-2 type transport system permease protein
MRNMLAVAGKELRAYFHSPIAYLVMTVYAVICGYVFYSSTAFFMARTFQMEAMGGMTVVLLFLIPLITMRLYAEEKRSGTIELLLTSPLTDLEIILGKFLGALALFAVLEAITFLYFTVLFIYGNPNARPLVAGAMGFFLYGAALMALGMWFSAFTKNQIIAGAVGLAVFLLLFLLDWVTAYSSGAAGRVMSFLALTTHFDNFSKGVINLGDLCYYLSVVIFGIFMTARSVEALKGRP